MIEMERQGYLEREYLARVIKEKGKEKTIKEIKFKAYTKEDAEERLLNHINKKLKTTKATKKKGKIIAENGDKKLTICGIRPRPSYILCGECRYFKSEDTGLEYLGICEIDKSETTNLKNCKFKKYYNDRLFNKEIYKSCLICGKPLKAEQKKYCSMKCGSKASKIKARLRKQQEKLEQGKCC